MESLEPIPFLRGTRGWTFLSNHAHVLVCLARDPDSRIRDVALAVGITERAAFRIVTELEEAKVVRRIREGRRNRYEIAWSSQLRHPLEHHQSIGSLLGIFVARPKRARGRKPTKETRQKNRNAVRL